MGKSRKKSTKASAQLDFFDLLDADSFVETIIDRSSNSESAFGFSGLPAGNYNSNNGNFNNVGNNANFWSSTENNSNNAYNMNLNYNNENANLNNNKNNARSVRCLQDSDKISLQRLQDELRFAYFQARKHKRNTVNQLQFEANLEANLLKLSHDLLEGSYEISRSVCFINEKPVKREIIAADFRDRVVHHLLFNWINPIFERQFIYDSYSCRVGKGTDFAISRAKHFMVSESRNFTRECYALRLDISGFFMSIDRDTLYSLIVDGLVRGRYGCVRGGVPVP